jgi:thioesterase domain-containing protein
LKAVWPIPALRSKAPVAEGRTVPVVADMVHCYAANLQSSRPGIVGGEGW